MFTYTKKIPLTTPCKAPNINTNEEKSQMFVSIPNRCFEMQLKVFLKQKSNDFSSILFDIF